VNSGRIISPLVSRNEQVLAVSYIYCGLHLLNIRSRSNMLNGDLAAHLAISMVLRQTDITNCYSYIVRMTVRMTPNPEKRASL